MAVTVKNSEGEKTKSVMPKVCGAKKKAKRLSKKKKVVRAYTAAQSQKDNFSPVCNDVGRRSDREGALPPPQVASHPRL